MSTANTDGSTSIPILPNGTHIGDFVLGDTIGHGGFSVVYRARQVKLDREVAVKVLKPQGNDTSVDSRRFIREINLVKALEHPNIIRLYDFGQTDDGKLWMATELVKGKTLSEVLHEQGPLRPARARHVVLQVLSALVEAHERGIIHRDIKPSNIMVARKGADLYFAKVLDFGIGKALVNAADDLSDDLSMEAGAGSGTPRYMAPEQFSKDDVGPHTDVYSLGLVLYEMLTATRAVPGSTVYEIVSRVCSEPVEFPESFHAAFRDIIYKATRPRYVDRYPTALAFYKTIEETIDEKGKDCRGIATAGPPPVPAPAGSDKIPENPSQGTSGVSGVLVEDPFGEASPDGFDDLFEAPAAAETESNHEAGAADPIAHVEGTTDSDGVELDIMDVEAPSSPASDLNSDADDVVEVPVEVPVAAAASPAEAFDKDGRLFNTCEAAFIESELEEGFDEEQEYEAAVYRPPLWKNSLVWGVAVGALLLVSVVAMVALVTTGDDQGQAEADGVAVLQPGDDGASADPVIADDDEGDDGDDDEDTKGADDTLEKAEGDGPAKDPSSEQEDSGEQVPAPVESVALSLVSSPAGAAVLSGGKVVCEATPCSLDVRPSKTVRLAFKLSGYSVKRVRLRPKESQTIDVTLLRPLRTKKKPAKSKKKKPKTNPFAKIKHH